MAFAESHHASHQARRHAKTLFRCARGSLRGRDARDFGAARPAEDVRVKNRLAALGAEAARRCRSGAGALFGTWCGAHRGALAGCGSLSSVRVSRCARHRSGGACRKHIDEKWIERFGRDEPRGRPGPCLLWLLALTQLLLLMCILLLRAFTTKALLVRQLLRLPLLCPLHQLLSCLRLLLLLDLLLLLLLGLLLHLLQHLLFRMLLHLLLRLLLHSHLLHQHLLHLDLLLVQIMLRLLLSVWLTCLWLLLL